MTPSAELIAHADSIELDPQRDYFSLIPPLHLKHLPLHFSYQLHRILPISHVSCGHHWVSLFILGAHGGRQNVSVYGVEVKFVSIKSLQSPSLGQCFIFSPLFAIWSDRDTTCKKYFDAKVSVYLKGLTISA